MGIDHIQTRRWKEKMQKQQELYQKQAPNKKDIMEQNRQESRGTTKKEYDTNKEKNKLKELCEYEIYHRQMERNWN